MRRSRFPARGGGTGGGGERRKRNRCGVIGRHRGVRGRDHEWPFGGHGRRMREENLSEAAIAGSIKFSAKMESLGIKEWFGCV